ncbi:MAG: hypothetical protein SAK29_17825 [Scytonema sp. PMC 1069.18]|nr:hypothetical protein [Scytonema sp. PMC 1069.18]
MKLSKTSPRQEAYCDRVTQPVKPVYILGGLFWSLLCVTSGTGLGSIVGVV